MQKHFMAAVPLAGLPAGTVALDCTGDGDSLEDGLLRRSGGST
jgi:hypothetical protein